MMTPVDSPECSAELQYNVAHAATHEIVDRTFRAIQSRFKCLDGTKGYLQVFCSSQIKKKYLIYITGLNLSTAVAVTFFNQLEPVVFGQFLSSKSQKINSYQPMFGGSYAEHISIKMNCMSDICSEISV